LNPVLVDVCRSSAVESCHRGSVIAINAEGKTLLALGDSDALVFPRSSLKPLQVMPLVESGAVDHLSMTDQELALACASHSGEPSHLQVLSQWMQRIGLDASQLECGPSLPLDSEAAHEHLRLGGKPGRELHNCSGKHTGMLALSVYLEETVQGYSEYSHVTQQSWMNVLSELSGVNVFDMPWDKDGCGLPAVALPLAAFAKAFLPFTIQCQAAATQRARAAARISAAMRSHPQMVAGSNRCCTASMQGGDNLLVKVGAEGVFIAVAIEAGVVIALKADDGANRAAEVMLGAALRQLGLLSSSQYDSLSRWYQPPIVNSQQAVVGSIRPSAAWSAL